MFTFLTYYTIQNRRPIRKRIHNMMRALHTENSGFSYATLPLHISTFRCYRILFSIRNPYINRFTNHFYYSFITILPSESGVTLHYCQVGKKSRRTAEESRIINTPADTVDISRDQMSLSCQF
jgi:hypothetical protein